MTGPFAGHGIPTNLNIQKSKLKDDSYFKLLNKVLDGENILNKYSFNDTKKFQENYFLIEVLLKIKRVI